MKISHYFLFMVTSAVFLTGCSSDDNTEAPQEDDTNQLNPVISSMKETHLSEPNDPNGFFSKQLY